MTIALIPIIVLLLAAVIIIVVIKNEEKKKANYDERQMLARFRAYRTAMWSMVVYFFTESLLVEFGFRWASPIVSSVTGICISLCIFVVYCIFNDAYFSSNEKPKSLIRVFTFLALVNAGNAYLSFVGEDGFITNGLLNYHCLNVIVVIMYVIIFASLCVKHALDKNKQRDE